MAGGLVIRHMRSALAGPFDLELAPGACLAVNGPSGAGKSLFLRMIADLDANEGEVSIGGVSRDSLPAPQWRRRAVYAPAEPGWWRERPIDHFDAARVDQARDLALKLRVDAGAFERPVAQLSTGERQRLALVRALVLAPPLLLLDEPTAALDPTAAEAVEAVLRDHLAAGVVLVLASHDPAQANRLGAERRCMVNRRFEAVG